MFLALGQKICYQSAVEVPDLYVPNISQNYCQWLIQIIVFLSNFKVSEIRSTDREGQSGQDVQKLHENYEISIFGLKQLKDIGRVTNFLGNWGGGGIPQNF